MGYEQALEMLKTVFVAFTSKEAISAVIGAGIAGGFGFQATKRAHAYALEKSIAEEKAVTRQMLELLMVEIGTALKIFDTEYASELDQLPDGALYVCQFPIGENTFALYDAAPACMANFKPEVAANIVRIHTRIKGMVAMIKANNEDTTQAHAAARMELLSLGGAALNDGQKIYRQLVMNAAVNLQMGSTADAMKRVAVEIRALHKQLSILVYGQPCLIE